MESNNEALKERIESVLEIAMTTVDSLTECFVAPQELDSYAQLNGAEEKIMIDSIEAKTAETKHNSDAMDTGELMAVNKTASTSDLASGDEDAAGSDEEAEETILAVVG